MKKIELTYEDYLPNIKIKKGDVFHGIYEVVSDPHNTKNGYEWKVYHRRWKVNLRMIRPEPALLLDIPEHEQQEIVSLYQREFIPMQLHPRIEAFYDVRHIGGSTAFFTEWCERGTLAECMTNGSLYRGEKEGVDKRLLHIVAQTARALQFLEEKGLPFGIVSPDNIMITDRFNAKLSVANLLAQIVRHKAFHAHSDKKQWAITALDIFVGKKINRELESIKDNCMDYVKGAEHTMSDELVELIAGALYGKLPSWQDVFRYLDDPLTRDYYPDSEGYENNRALRLIDCGKWESAFKILDTLFRYHFKSFPFEYNLALWYRYMTKEKMAQSYGGVGMQEMLRKPTDILLYAEWNDRKSVEWLIEQYGNRLPSFVARYLPEIHEKLLDRPRMTREDLKEGDPRIKAWGEDIIIELDGEAVTFKPLPEGCDKINIPSRDGLVWDKDRLVLPDSGIIKGLDYTVRVFDGGRFLFDEGYTRLLTISGTDAHMYPLAQYDNRFRAPFLLYQNNCYEDEV